MNFQIYPAWHLDMPLHHLDIAVTEKHVCLHASLMLSYLFIMFPSESY